MPSVSEPDRNAVWAGAFAEELAHAGVRDVCVAPGSRSTPLVLACARLGAFRMRVHLDERSAGFFALGVGKATGTPAAVITTSGTAAANLFPAVVEASQSESPLLVLTADRPHRLRDSDANQAIDQLRLFGLFVREFFEVAPAEVGGPALRHLRTLAARAVASAVGLPAGPVHLNFPFEFPFDVPLEPQDDTPDGAPDGALVEAHPRAARGRAGERPYIRVRPRRPRLDKGELDALAERLAASRRPLLVVGPTPEPDRLRMAVVSFASAVGLPVLADPLSGVRYGPDGGACIYGAYDLFLREPRARSALAPDLVLRVGRSPTSAALLDYLADAAYEAHLLIDPSFRWKDHLAVASDVVRADAADTLTRLAERGRPARLDSDWCALWTRLERTASVALTDLLQSREEGERFEGMVAQQTLRAMNVPGTLFVSSSMPIRDLDAFGGRHAVPLRVLGNRGASGIDGIVSTALGVAAGAGEPVVALVGDIALLHDANGLLAAREPDVQVVFVVVNNDGGGIFHFLPVRAHEPHFTRLFATPHGIEPERVAALYGLSYERAEPETLAERVREAIAAGGTRLIEVRTDRETNRRRRVAAIERARAAALAALDAD